MKYMVQLAPKRNVAGSIPVRDATSEWISLHSDFFYYFEKINHALRHSSSFCKRHARLACSLTSVLSDGSLSLPPFCEYACGGISLCFGVSFYVYFVAL